MGTLRHRSPEPPDRLDEAARAAARLLHDGRTASVRDAIRLAAERADLPVGAIRERRVRDHLRGLTMEAIGADGYRARLAEILSKAETAMALLETLPGEPTSALVGRTARSQIDGEAACRIRVHTDRTSAEIAARLVEAGYEEPSFGRIESRYGRLEQVIVDDDGVELRITRCPTAMRVPDDMDLRSGAKIATLDASGVREAIAALSR